METEPPSFSGTLKLIPPTNNGSSMKGESSLSYRAEVTIALRRPRLFRGRSTNVDDLLGQTTFRVDTPVTDAAAQAFQQRLQWPVVYRGPGVIDFPIHALRGVTDFVIDIETKPLDVAAAGGECGGDPEFRGETFQLVVTRRQMNAHCGVDGWTHFVLATQAQREARFEAIVQQYDLYRRTDRAAQTMLGNLYIALCEGLDGPLWGRT